MFTKIPTEAVLFRTEGMLGIDEFERVNNQQKAGVREILNSSYKKGVKIMRMKKVKNIEGESQVVEEFESYRPIAIANIWGMEEVLGDRCISIVLEKSDNPVKTRLMPDFYQDEVVTKVRKMLNQCSLCSVVSQKNIYKEWNNYIIDRYKTTLTTYYTLTTLTTLTTLKDIKLDNLFSKIHDSNIKGRNLELFLPLLFIGSMIDDDVFVSVLKTAVELSEEKEHDDVIESKDIAVIEFISNMDISVDNYHSVKQLMQDFKTYTDESEEWMNVKWFGRALKRLSLVKDKRRTSAGIEVIPDVQKAIEKIKMFKN